MLIIKEKLNILDQFLNKTEEKEDTFSRFMFRKSKEKRMMTFTLWYLMYIHTLWSM